MDKFVIVQKSPSKRKGEEIPNDEGTSITISSFYLLLGPTKKVAKTEENKASEGESKEEIPKALEIPADCIMAQTLSDQKWRNLLAKEFAKPYYKNIEKLVAERRKVVNVYPPVEEVFAAFNCCPLDKIKVVIIGQDPYFNPGQAEGLCFSVKKGITPPPSLNRIYKVCALLLPFFPYFLLIN